MITTCDDIVSWNWSGRYTSFEIWIRKKENTRYPWHYCKNRNGGWTILCIYNEELLYHCPKMTKTFPFWKCFHCETRLFHYATQLLKSGSYVLWHALWSSRLLAMFNGKGWQYWIDTIHQFSDEIFFRTFTTCIIYEKYSKYGTNSRNNSLQSTKIVLNLRSSFWTNQSHPRIIICFKSLFLNPNRPDDWVMRTIIERYWEKTAVTRW